MECWVQKRKKSILYSGVVLTSATLHFVGWVEPISGYFGFRFSQPNLHFVSAIVQCETQKWLTPLLQLLVIYTPMNPFSFPAYQTGQGHC